MEGNSETILDDFREQAILRFKESLSKIEGCLKVMNDDTFWAKPNENSNGIAQILRHLQGNIGQYILSGLTGKPDLRDRPSEFSPTVDRSREEVIQSFFEVAETAVEVMTNVTDSTLLRRKRVQGFELTGLGIILHVVEHLSYHTGQIVFETKRTGNIDLGFYRDFDLNQKNE